MRIILLSIGFSLLYTTSCKESGKTSNENSNTEAVSNESEKSDSSHATSEEHHEDHDDD